MYSWPKPLSWSPLPIQSRSAGVEGVAPGVFEQAVLVVVRA